MKKIFIYLILLSAVMISCKKEKDLNVDITKSNLDTYIPGVLDKWLETNFLNPYNIEVLYRFDRYQAKIDKEIAPVMMNKVQPIMEGVDAVFIKPYLEMTSKTFLLPLLPKEIALFGSGEYSDDQLTLGTADAGRQINLYVVNSYDRNDYSSVMGSAEQPAAFHTMHHEFVHILNQNIPVPPSYEDISSNYVGSAWVGGSNPTEVARDLGFITRYARNNKNEDFAEMASTLLVEGQDHFEWYLNQATDATGVAKLRKKEQAVVDYYKSAFNLDFRLLQNKVRTAIETYAPVTKISATEWFAEGAYKGFVVNKSATNQGSDFVAAYNESVAVATVDYESPIRPTFQLEMVDISENTNDMILKFSDGGYSYWYNLTATVSNGASATLKFSLAEQGTTAPYGNSAFLEDAMDPILDYLTTTTFKMDWVENLYPGSRNNLMGFFDASTGKLAFYGSIQK